MLCCCHALLTFFEKFFQEYHQGVSLDPDQARCFIKPDLDQNCLNALLLSADFFQNHLFRKILSGIPA